MVNRSINLFSDNVIDHFRKIMKILQYQAILEKWFSKDSKPNEPNPLQMVLKEK